MLAGAVGKGRDAKSVQQLLALATDAKQPAPIRLALMNGLNSGLRGGVPQVNQQVAGGRAGGGVPGTGRRGTGTKPIDLAAEPGALATLAKGQGEQAEMAAQLVEVVNWPGKPVTAVAAVARTPQQQALFAQGKGIYDQLCVGCHMAAGEGAPNVGAALAGSRFVNAQPTVPARILLAGKEGSIGLMPPIGATMTDEELAAILTFVRGSFGNTSSPVAPAEAKEWRTMYAFRKLPWTEQELMPAGGGARATRRR
jgi:mono/diheme cytochrome c family protein